LSCRSTKTHPGPVVHLSDSPRDEGKVSITNGIKTLQHFTAFICLDSSLFFAYSLVLSSAFFMYLQGHFYYFTDFKKENLLVQF